MQCIWTDAFQPLQAGGKMTNKNRVHAVVKFGGHALNEPEIRSAFLKDLRALRHNGKNIALTHGGGPQINRLLKRLGIESSFRNGLRVTTPEVLETVEMILCGQTNKEITRLLQKEGIKCAGISGEDGKLLEAEQLDPELGLVGKITRVNPAIILALLDNGFLPIIAPLAVDRDGNPLNVNADTAAAHIAGSLGAPWFILLSDVPGVLDSEGKLQPVLSVREIDEMKKQGVIHGGMIPKVDACLYALAHGCASAIIMDGSQQGSLASLLENGEAAGTVIIA